jgi:hypothetical protein
MILLIYSKTLLSLTYNNDSFISNLFLRSTQSSIIESFRELRECLRLAEQHQEVLEQRNIQKITQERVDAAAAKDASSASSGGALDLGALSSLADVASAAADSEQTNGGSSLRPVPDLIGSMIGQMIGEETENSDVVMTNEGSFSIANEHGSGSNGVVTATFANTTVANLKPENTSDNVVDMDTFVPVAEVSSSSAHAPAAMCSS